MEDVPLVAVQLRHDVVIAIRTETNCAFFVCVTLSKGEGTILNASERAKDVLRGCSVVTAF